MKKAVANAGLVEARSPLRASWRIRGEGTRRHHRSWSKCMRKTNGASHEPLRSRRGNEADFVGGGGFRRVTSAATRFMGPMRFKMKRRLSMSPKTFNVQRSTSNVQGCELNVERLALKNRISRFEPMNHWVGTRSTASGISRIKSSDAVERVPTGFMGRVSARMGGS